MQSNVDNWGEPIKHENPKDWESWALWETWSTQYNWVEEEDFIEQDVIVWRDNIMQNAHAGSKDKKPKWVKTGERLIIARVCRIERDGDQYIYLMVMFCDGDDPYQPDAKIKRFRRNILRNGIRRLPREGSVSPDHAQKPVEYDTSDFSDDTHLDNPEITQRSKYVNPAYQGSI